MYPTKCYSIYLQLSFSHTISQQSPWPPRAPLHRKEKRREMRGWGRVSWRRKTWLYHSEFCRETEPTEDYIHRHHISICICTHTHVYMWLHAKIYFKELAYMFVRLASQICRAMQQAGNSGREWYHSFEAEFLLETSVFVLKAFN